MPEVVNIVRDLQNLLSNPFEAELRLKLSDQMLEGILKQYFSNPYIKEIRVVCSEGYLELTVKPGIPLLTMNLKISIELSRIDISENEMRVIFAIKGSKFSPLGVLLKVMFYKSKLIWMLPDRRYQLDLSEKWKQKKRKMKESVRHQLDKVSITHHKITKGFLEIMVLKSV